MRTLIMPRKLIGIDLKKALFVQCKKHRASYFKIVFLHTKMPTFLKKQLKHSFSFYYVDHFPLTISATIRVIWGTFKNLKKGVSIHEWSKIL